KEGYVTGGGPTWVAIGDLNRDGAPDLVTANYSAYTVSVLLSTRSVGNGPFAVTETDFATGSNPVSVAAGDLNCDGRLDLAVANLISNSVTVLLGDGSGGMTPSLDVATGDAPSSVAIGD